MINRHLDLSLPELKEIITNESITSLFQPILSARNHSVIGFEGLIRGKTRNGNPVPPVLLFDTAREYDLSLELDRLCREKVLAAFENIYHLHKNSLLFLNLETSFLSSKVVGSGYLLNQISRYKIPPANIVIEIVESNAMDNAALLRFASAYRECGLNIALDDVGTGHSNFDRISLIKPDIIKVDRSIICGMAGNYFKQQIFKSLSNLSKNIKCLTLAEGVETEEEVLLCIEYGADLLQGYFFSRPKDIDHQALDAEEGKLKDILLTFKMKQIEGVKARRLQNEQYQKIVQSIVGNIQEKSLQETETVLRDIADASPLIEALYIIDNEGIQVTETFMKRSRHHFVNPLFRAASKNENLSHKDYVYQLINTDLTKYTTDRYISFATGNLCVTLSYLFKGENGRDNILCTDFIADDRG